jgi:hypothetical protein
VPQRHEVLNELKEYINQAHDDFRVHLRDIAHYKLDPLGDIGLNDPAAGYPQCLNIETLKTYFGEIFSGIVAENFEHFNESGWKVPAYLFRFHLVALQQLERIRQTGEAAGIIPGRTGDDCLAFQRNDQGRIIRSLFCEAKCTRTHSRTLINEAHEKLSDSMRVPVDIILLTQILESHGDQDSVSWANSLHQLHLADYQANDYERCDLVTYICGRRPVRTTTWISTTVPENTYRGRRRLESVEVHIEDVLGLVRQVYGIGGD